jgi:hypothetical protein
VFGNLSHLSFNILRILMSLKRGNCAVKIRETIMP